MALTPSRWWLVPAWLSIAFLVACAGESNGKTEVLVSIDAFGQARDSTSVRIEVNAAVVELPALPGKQWPLEVLVMARDEMADKTFRVRAWGMSGSAVNGSGEKEGSFKKGKRTGLEIMLDPAVDLGAPPPVNAQVGPGKIVLQPDSPSNPDLDAGDEPALDAAQDTGTATNDPDAGDGESALGGDCDASGTCDSGTPEGDGCVPSPMDCGGCGLVCADTKQCIDDQCRPVPDPQCEPPFQVLGHTYQYCRDLRSWDSARIACRARGYDLVIFNSLDEYAAVKKALPAVATNDYWLGGHDRGDNGTGYASCTRSTAEGIWRWVDPATGSEEGMEFCRFASSNATSCTQSNGAYFTWTSGQPDNDGCSCGLFNIGACNNAEDCLVMGISGWNDTACSDARTYLCEDF